MAASPPRSGHPCVGNACVHMPRVSGRLDGLAMPLLQERQGSALIVMCLPTRCAMCCGDCAQVMTGMGLTLTFEVRCTAQGLGTHVGSMWERARQLDTLCVLRCVLGCSTYLSGDETWQRQPSGSGCQACTRHDRGGVRVGKLAAQEAHLHASSGRQQWALWSPLSPATQLLFVLVFLVGSHHMLRLPQGAIPHRWHPTCAPPTTTPATMCRRLAPCSPSSRTCCCWAWCCSTRCCPRLAS